MRNLIHYFIERSLVVNVITVIVTVIGGFALYFLQKETFPSIEFGRIMVHTFYPGSSAEDSEKLVTIPLERSIKGVDGIEEINAISLENNSRIFVKVAPDAEIKEVLADVKDAVEAVTDLPDDVEVPRVVNFHNKRRGIINVPLTGGNYRDLRVVAKKLRDVLERFPEIAEVELDGHRIDEIRVEVDPVAMNRHQISVREVHRALRERNLNLSAGLLEAPGGDLFVRTLAEFEGVEDIEKVVIRSNNSGRKILVGDVASVERVPTQGAVLLRSNGARAIYLDVKARERADVLRTTAKVKAKVNEFFDSGDYPEVKYDFTRDLSYYVKRRLNILKDNGLVGMVLVFLCLLAFLDFRISVVTSLGAPIAFMVSFVVMHITGVSINLVSMFALILVLGMLVDDSIIVSEHFYQKLEDGMRPKRAALDAAFETVRPVTATILTTIVAFGALFFMGGTMGKFLWSVPAVVIICLLASWFECFFILPSHLADFVPVAKHRGQRRWYHALTEIYIRHLKVLLKYHWAIFAAFIAVLGGSVFVGTKMDFELFPGDDVRNIYVQIKGAVGTPLETSNRAVAKLEQMSLKELDQSELEHLRSRVGILIEEGSRRRKIGGHYASLAFNLTPPDVRARSTDQIIEALVEKARPLVPGYTVTASKIQGGPPRGKAVDIQLSGDSLEELLDAAKKIEGELKIWPGITSTEIDFEEGKEQVIIVVDDAEARRLGLSTATIALELRHLLSGEEVTQIRESDEDIKIRMFLDDHARTRVESLQLLHIDNQEGRRIPLSRLAKLERRPGAFVIRRLDYKRVISVQATINKAETTPIQVAQTFRPKVREVVSQYPGIAFEFGGENKDTKESMSNLAKAGWIALSCIFIILVVMFNGLWHSIVVLSAVPLGLIGVVWTFLIAGKSLGFMALMGVVALSGVVVNDSIVLVNFINKRRESEKDLVAAVVEAARSRFRPVILTTFTTVAGLLPIAHPTISKILTLGRTVDSDPFIQPMALSFAWGLMFASVVTLIFIPCGYIGCERFKQWFFSKVWRSEEWASAGK